MVLEVIVQILGFKAWPQEFRLNWDRSPFEVRLACEGIHLSDINPAVFIWEYFCHQIWIVPFNHLELVAISMMILVSSLIAEAILKVLGRLLHIIWRPFRESLTHSVCRVSLQKRAPILVEIWFALMLDISDIWAVHPEFMSNSRLCVLNHPSSRWGSHA